MSTVAEAPRSRGWLSILGWLLPFAAAIAAFPLVQREWFTRNDGYSEIPLTGNGLSGGLTQALALAVMAAMMAMLAFGANGRRLLAGIVAALGAWMLLIAATARVPDDSDVSGNSIQVHASPTTNLWAFMVVAVVVIVGAAIVLRWPGAQSGRQRVEGAGDDQWVVLDRGEDPTTA